jgi:hypothetical protein
MTPRTRNRYAWSPAGVQVAFGHEGSNSDRELNLTQSNHEWGTARSKEDLPASCELWRLFYVAVVITATPEITRATPKNDREPTRFVPTAKSIANPAAS